ncbi:MAG: response regulator transcription factor [Ferruginibacter sp.]
MSIKLMITDDHPVVTNGLLKIFDGHPAIQVSAVFSNGKDLLNELKVTLPDILLLDMNLPDMTGMELASEIIKKYPSVKIIILSSSDIIIQVKKMLQLGCQGYLLKDSDDVTIVKAIEAVNAGEQFLSPVLQQQILNDLFKKKQAPAELTRREKEILQLITEEFTNQEIADKLFISPHTVDNHRVSLLSKLQAKNTAGLVRRALEQGLVK